MIIKTLLENIVLRRLLDRDMSTTMLYPDIKNYPAAGWYVATFLDKTVGVIGYNILGRNCVITYIFVHESFRLQGIGRALVDRVYSDVVSITKSVTIHVPLVQDVCRFAATMFDTLKVLDETIIMIKRRR